MLGRDKRGGYALGVPFHAALNHDSGTLISTKKRAKMIDQPRALSLVAELGGGRKEGKKAEGGRRLNPGVAFSGSFSCCSRRFPSARASMDFALCPLPPHRALVTLQARDRSEPSDAAKIDRATPGSC